MVSCEYGDCFRIPWGYPCASRERGHQGRHFLWIADRLYLPVVLVRRHWAYSLERRRILTKPVSKKKKDYAEGAKAQKAFEETMKALFRAPKADSKKFK